MSTRPTAGNATSRRWEGALVAVLLGLAAISWVVTARWSLPEMRTGLLTRAPAPPMAGDSMALMTDGLLHPTPMLGLFLLTWLVMMVAMMFPAVVPVVVTFDRWRRRKARPKSATALFVGGYLLGWSVFGLVVYAAMLYLEPLLPAGATSVRWGAALLILAGAYQLTGLKARCLKQCRSPLAFVAEHATQLRRGGFGPAKVGLAHGMFCLGCCWALMLVLVLLGMMSLAWMAAVAGVIFVEKVLPIGSRVPPVVAAVLIGLGGFLLVLPQALLSLN
ncbi:MAG: DUF2182 domain-containing protein [Actinomycetota bacterium]